MHFEDAIFSFTKIEYKKNCRFKKFRTLSIWKIPCPMLEISNLKNWKNLQFVRFLNFQIGKFQNSKWPILKICNL